MQTALSAARRLASRLLGEIDCPAKAWRLVSMQTVRGGFRLTVRAFRPSRASILVTQGVRLSIDFIVRFEPLLGKEKEFRQELLRVVEPTRAEPGCVAIRVLESLREPSVFAIHSEWVDEEAFELHARMPHTVRFLQAAGELLTHAVEGLRSRGIAGGPGAGAPK